MIISVIFVDDEPGGEVCAGCKEEITEKKWVMMLDFGDPVNFPPAPLDVIYCTKCKNEFEN